MDRFVDLSRYACVGVFLCVQSAVRNWFSPQHEFNTDKKKAATYSTQLEPLLTEEKLD